MNLPPTPTPALLAAALPDHPHWLDSIGYQINGLIVVFVALSLIWGMLEIMGFVFRRAQRVAGPAPVVAPVPAAPDEIPLEQVAAITAAVKLALDGPHRIDSIEPAEPVLDWAHEGRRQIFASHKTR